MKKLVIACALVVSACGTVDNDGETNNAGTNNGETNNAATVSFANDIVPIINANCNVGGCHAGTGNGNFAIDGTDPAAVQAALAGVSAISGKLLIAPDELSESEIHIRITGSARAQMPLGGQLSQEDIDTIEAWILAGAQFDT